MFCRYSIHDLKGENNYMLNGKVKVCLQKGGGSCLFTKTLFENTKIQKFGCDWSHSEFKIPGIIIFILSFSSWLIGLTKKTYFTMYTLILIQVSF